jgi:hypothetical protein
MNAGNGHLEPFGRHHRMAALPVPSEHHPGRVNVRVWPMLLKKSVPITQAEHSRFQWRAQRDNSKLSGQKHIQDNCARELTDALDEGLPGWRNIV